MYTSFKRNVITALASLPIWFDQSDFQILWFGSVSYRGATDPQAFPSGQVLPPCLSQCRRFPGLASWSCSAACSSWHMSRIGKHCSEQLKLKENRAGEMAQSVKFLLYKHLVPRTQIKKVRHDGERLQSECWGGWDKRVPGAHWPARLTHPANSRIVWEPHFGN